MMPTIGILADSGQPLADASRILRSVLSDIREGDTLRGTWPGIGPVELREGTVPMSPDGEVELGAHAAELLDAHGWSRLIYLTDLPLSAWEKPVVSQRFAEVPAVLLSLPALGAFGVRRRLRRELSGLVEHDELSAGVFREGPDPAEHADSADQPGVETRVLQHPGLTLRMVAGMVRSNEPGRLLPVLSSSLAAMVATGGFGIFYGSIWQLAEELTFWRLLLISVFATVSFTGWLIVHNRLWQRRHTQESRWREMVDNLATVGTIGMAAITLHFAVWLIMVLASVAVIPRAYLEGELERDVGMITYLSIAWLSASLGAMAGALGSNFDRDVEIRSATYNLREHERRARRWAGD
ncbi:MAG: hypothetical protein Q4G50_04550 [Corynebacterium sp.]|uniref:hypothetical protein n=1 Tax=Corynebacterium sp. TaxID=1720 RepID=UPI0026DF3863|nr:hypothetical protein [Corynebacterium sp.]MDO5669250.1 hypothetical protein [Corynebacterium sp.]